MRVVLASLLVSSLPFLFLLFSSRFVSSLLFPSRLFPSRLVSVFSRRLFHFSVDFRSAVCSYKRRPIRAARVEQPMNISAFRRLFVRISLNLEVPTEVASCAFNHGHQHCCIIYPDTSMIRVLCLRQPTDVLTDRHTDGRRRLPAILSDATERRTFGFFALAI